MRKSDERSRQLAHKFRRELTKAEVILWQNLRRNALGQKFRRQHPIGPYVADFACTSQRLVVEVDGATHRTPEELAHDARRTSFLQAHGWRVLRVWNTDVYENMDGVWRLIHDALPLRPPLGGLHLPRKTGEDWQRQQSVRSWSAHKGRGNMGARTISPQRVLIASVIGSVIEWYDYALYGTAAALVFGHVFFPTLDPGAELLASTATFAAGFIARPLGGILAGHLGDRVGRKAVLVTVVLTMGLSTAAIGMIPGYDSIGILAPALLVALRLLQGLAVGGAWGGSVLMAIEFAPPEKRGMWAAWPHTGVSMGFVLGAGAFTAASTFLSEAEFLAWGWRLPFLVSILLAAVGLYIRFQTTESPEFRRVIESAEVVRAPLVEVLKNHWGSVLRGFGARFPDATSYYILTVYLLAFGTSTLGVPRATMLTAVMLGAGLNVVSLPFWGAVSDKLGRRTVFTGGALFLAAAAAPFFWVLQTREPVWIIIAFIVMFNTGYAAAYGSLAAYLAELFPARVRFTGASVAYQAAAIFPSGFTPMIASALVLATGGSAWPVIAYVAATALVGAIAVGTGPETRGRDLS